MNEGAIYPRESLEEDQVLVGEGWDPEFTLGYVKFERLGRHSW